MEWKLHSTGILYTHVYAYVCQADSGYLDVCLVSEGLPINRKSVCVGYAL